MNRLLHILTFLVAVLLVAADKKPDSAHTAAQIQQWVKQLGDDSFKVREEATRDLINAGRAVLGAVTTATKSKDPEVKQRALMIIKNVAIAYFMKFGTWVVRVDEKSASGQVIGLYLRETKITDAGLVHLKGLTNLQYLVLFGTNVTDAGLVHLKGLAKLQRLSLRYTKITDAGLAHLKGLTNLNELDLAGTKVTDAGLVNLKGLASLEKFYLRNTNVTDAGLVHLRGLTKLKSLYVVGTEVTKAGIEKLQKTLPNCGIAWDGK